ncbi:MAG: DUF1540 domain-containing protein [Oscillospiraceae bacterium]|nr:DUF1540 domain-containing protein [Oscillospiraceae bacterium]
MFGYNETTQNGVLQGVSCDVKSCAYHDTSNCCHASNITVGNPAAHSTDETKCSTYKLQAGM